MFRILCLFVLSLGLFAQTNSEPITTFRVGVIPAEFFKMFNLPISPEVRGADQVTITITKMKPEAFGWQVVVISKTGKVSTQIVFRREHIVCTGDTCDAYLPIAQFWVFGGVDKVTVQPLVLGESVTQSVFD